MANWAALPSIAGPGIKGGQTQAPNNPARRREKKEGIEMKGRFNKRDPPGSALFCPFLIDTLF